MVRSFLMLLIFMGFLEGCARVEIVGSSYRNEPYFGSQISDSVDGSKLVFANVVVDDRLIYPYDSYSNTEAFVAISNAREELVLKMQDNGFRFIDSVDLEYNLFSVYQGTLYRYRPQYFTQFYLGDEKAEVQKYFEDSSGLVGVESDVVVVLSNGSWWVDQIAEALPDGVDYIGLIEIGISSHLPYDWSSSASVSKNTNTNSYGNLLGSYQPQITIGVFDKAGSFVVAHGVILSQDDLWQSEALYTKLTDMIAAAGIH